ncbi:MAG: 30S ribosomal protein S4e [Nitrososphaeria archaeon]
MGSSRHMKRHVAPAFWKISRKHGQFITKPSPGPHAVGESYSLATLLRDVLKVVRTMREANSAIASGKVMVDGVVRRNRKFPVGLMDVIQIPLMNKAFRLLPAKEMMLYPAAIDVESSKLKLCKVRSKKKAPSNLFQYGLHDGRTILSKEDLGVNVNDSLLIAVPEGKVISKVKMEKGSLVMFLKGRAAGKLGVVNNIYPGSLYSMKSAEVEVGGLPVKAPMRLLMAVGVEKPVLPLGGEI